MEVSPSFPSQKLPQLPRSLPLLFLSSVSFAAHHHPPTYHPSLLPPTVLFFSVPLSSLFSSFPTFLTRVLTTSVAILRTSPIPPTYLFDKAIEPRTKMSATRKRKAEEEPEELVSLPEDSDGEEEEE